MALFETFENYLKKSPLKQKALIYSMPLMVAACVAFMVVLPMQQEELDTLENQKQLLQTNIKRKSPRVLTKKLESEKAKLLTLKDEVFEKRDSLHYLKAKLTNLEILGFDEQQWTVTLDDILKESLTLDLKIKHIKNSNSEQKNFTSHIVPNKYVEIIGRGAYANIIKYINFIEERDFLVDVTNINIQKEDSLDANIHFHINFVIYGVTI